MITFYNGCLDLQLGDYRNGNLRVEEALELAAEHIKGGRILDIGCGVGWTSSRLAELGEVTGVDLSPVLIQTARAQFGKRARFIIADASRLLLSGHFDGIVMIDVYEHIPRTRYEQLHSRLADWLRGSLVLTCPTVATQDYAREHGIALQPVDEDITDEDITDLAAAVGGEIIVNHPVSVWRPDDYRHVVIRNA